ncbi:MAG: hemerythrin domain-containing protein [Rhodobacteraceae bacterium]|nr:hemerythrin domain-containing protein [Paracoccaceae bacterium]
MHFTRRTAQLLHEDHQATIAVIEALDQMIAKARKATPDTNDPGIRAVLKSAAGAIKDEINKHFAFEEDELFTRLEEMGDVAIGAHLREEHAAILPLGQQVADRAARALDSGFSGDEWTKFRTFAGELIERMFAHIQKEEMALLPMLEDILDDETDMELSTRYANTHT